jgi:ferredoxin
VKIFSKDEVANETLKITINGITFQVPPGVSVLQAAQQAVVDIPTLCHLDGFPHNTSCMICMVEDKTSGRLLPSCSAPTVDGMIIETDNDRVREFRRDALELLLSEHVGDCLAPCHRTCPALMNIPLMIRQIQQQDWAAAIRTVKAEIALPAVLGRICSAPCESACTRKQHDGAVSICLLKRIVADKDLAFSSPYRPECATASGKSVAVVGAGPAGLAAAYYLRQFGHAVTVFDKQMEPGGNLRYAVPEALLPRAVLDAEIQQIEALGVTFRMSMEAGIDFSLPVLTEQFDAVALATGAGTAALYESASLVCTPKGMQVNRATFAASLPGVFACGSVVAESRMAVRAVGQGRTMAISIDQYLTGREVVGRATRFNSLLGRLHENEAKEFLKDASENGRIEPSADGFSANEAVAEASRCFHCDCRKPSSCKLRRYADEYGADQKKYKISKRLPFERQVQHELVLFEPGKCIKCGLCVQITARAKERFGLTFIRRGFNVKITVPFNEALEHGLEKVARDCAEACPTAAIALREIEGSSLR